MNTAFNSWSSKFVVSFYYQRLKPLYQLKVFESLKMYHPYPSNEIFLKASGILFSLHGNIIQLESSVYLKNKQALRLLSISKNRCWKCNAVVTERDLVCMGCGSVQEPNQKLNFFEVFKETPHFDLDVKNLTFKFRRLQTLLHPDKIASRPEREKGYSAEQSALVNRAYQTLLLPIDRGLYLLELLQPPGEKSPMANPLPPDFLASVLEAGEALSGLPLPNKKEVAALRRVNAARSQLLHEEVSQSFREMDLVRACEVLCKLRCLINLEERIRALEQELGIRRED